MVIVGLPYSCKAQMRIDEITGGSPYGASTIAGGDGSRQPSENELAGARYQGRVIAETANKLHATYAAGAEIFLTAFAGQTSLPWPYDFPRKTDVANAKDIRELNPQPSDDSAFQP